jgi:hypothetical protein
MSNRKTILCLCLAVSLPGGGARANGVGENASWQFLSTAEMANLAYIEEIRKKSAGGAYKAAQQTYYIDTQNNYNCSNAASSAGNGGSNSATANTPSSAGASGSALGNQNTGTGSTQGLTGDVVLNSGQENYGPSVASVTGDSLATASGNRSNQALNTVQNNHGIQDASVIGSNGCAFAGPGGLLP